MDSSNIPYSFAAVAMSFLDMTDTDTVACAQMGDRRAAERLLNKYQNLVKTAVRRFYIPGAERDDILQIGMLGLWQAIVDFRSDRSSSFPAFARVCIRRHLLTAIKSARRQKQAALNTSLPLETAAASERPFQEAPVGVCAGGTDPEATMISQEHMVALRRALRRVLSDFEWRVLGCFQSGMSYHEIATQLGCKVKSVDNALVRIRRKALAVRAADDIAPIPSAGACLIR